MHVKMVRLLGLYCLAKQHLNTRCAVFRRSLCLSYARCLFLLKYPSLMHAQWLRSTGNINRCWQAC